MSDSKSSLPGTVLAFVLLAGVLMLAVYLVDWLWQPNTPEQLCGDVADGNAEIYKTCLDLWPMDGVGARHVRQGW